MRTKIKLKKNQIIDWEKFQCSTIISKQLFESEIYAKSFPSNNPSGSIWTVSEKKIKMALVSIPKINSFSSTFSNLSTTLILSTTTTTPPSPSSSLRSSITIFSGVSSSTSSAGYSTHNSSTPVTLTRFNHRRSSFDHVDDIDSASKVSVLNEGTNERTNERKKKCIQKLCFAIDCE